MSDTDRNNLIAAKFRELADLFHGVAQGAGPATVKTVGQHLADAGITTNPHAITAEQVDAMKAPEVAKADKAKRATKAKVDTPESKADTEALIRKPTAPTLTPEQIASEIKNKLVALCQANRAKAVAVLASVGASKFSSIPVDKHPEVLLALVEALTTAKGDDPLS